MFSSPPTSAAISLDELQSRIEAETAAFPHLAAIREHNHTVLRDLDSIYPLRGRTVLDLGGSSHGYALEAALELGAIRYESINLSVDSLSEVVGPGGATGRLHAMDAARLDFPDNSFDAAVSISTFEHFHRPAEVLAELHRVMRPGGAALISFEPVWTSARGHHLHHFGLADILPPWAHLLLDEAKLAEVLAQRAWPEGAPVSRAEVVDWIYRGDGINRLPLSVLRREFENSLFNIEWMVPLEDGEAAGRTALAAYVASLLPWRAEDLLTRGLSLLLRKTPAQDSAPTQMLFDEGFCPAEITPDGLLRWAGTRATLRLRTPVARWHRLALRLVTPFWEGAQQVEVRHGDHLVGTLEFAGSDLAQAAEREVEINLAAGPNTVTLTACHEARPLSSTDGRLAAFGVLTDAAD